MTTDVEPWQAFYDTPTFLPPGELVRWQREEARLRAEERREEAERRDRADARLEAAIWEARQYTVAKGLPWNYAKPFEHVPTVWQRADAMFAYQDAQARRDDLSAAKEAGLVHLLHQGVPSPHPGVSSDVSPGGDSPPTPGPSVSGSGSEVAARGRIPAMTDPRTDTSSAGKARRALRRWSARERRQRFEETR
jgi:hypothetical protein